MTTEGRKLNITVEVEAMLCISYSDPNTGDRAVRPATEEDLHRLRLFSSDEMYEVTTHNLAALGIDKSQGIGSSLRYLIEQSTHYLNKITDTSEDREEFEDLVKAVTK